MKVLVIEDDADLARQLAQTLNQHRYQVEIAADSETGLALIEATEYDLLLLDLHLPNLESIYVCEKLRATGSTLPILLVTAENVAEAKLAGLEAGADDYVLKPSELAADELISRVRSLLQKATAKTQAAGPSSQPTSAQPTKAKSAGVSTALCWGALTVETSHCEVRIHSRAVPVTYKEYELLSLFLRHPQRVFSLSALIDRLWTAGSMPSEAEVRTEIERMQHKLSQSGLAESAIETVYGLGYRLRATPSNREQFKDGSENVSIDLTSPTAPTASPFALESLGKSIRSKQPLDTLKVIWSRYRQEYLNLVTDLEQVVTVVPHGPADVSLAISDDPAVLAAARQAIHTLKGALGSFGFMELSGISAQAERLISIAPQLNREQGHQLSELIAHLRHMLQSSISAKPTKGQLKAFASTHSAVCEWLIVSCDMELTEDLIHQASIWRLETRMATTASEVRAVLSTHSPDVIVLDIDCINEPRNGIGFLRELTGQYPSLSVIVMSNHDSLRDRIQVIRAGACTFLAKPITSAQVIEAVTHRLAQRTQLAARIVALDDDPSILLYLKHLLTPWGFQLTLVSDPLQLWEAIEQTVPDLLILDIEMPEINGIELCKVIRSDPKLGQLPILFLSAHTDTEIVSQVFECGADDYVSKPIIGPELVARILNRLERLRLLQKLAETDDLTGLSRRRQSVDALERSLKLASRQRTTVCLALLDLDHFKQINDRYGHEIGDKVLKTLGDYLRETFRGEDVVARWGGEEFMVGLYGTPKSIAVVRLETFLRAFFQHIFQGNNQQRFQVSFSGGVAAYPADGSNVQQLYRCADEALYRAKAAGRSRILPAE